MKQLGKHIAFILSLLILTSCFNEVDTSNLKVFHYNSINNITSLDPAFARSQVNIWAVHHLHNGLVALDDNLNIIPDLANSWSVSEDGKTYTFQLRKDVFFHDNECFENAKGRKVNANDFVYSLNRIIDKKVNSPGSWIFSGKLDEVAPFTAPNDSTFILKLNAPFRPMLGILSMQYCSVVPEEAINFYGKKFRANPVGTGPFKFKKWLENQALFLIKNENYFQEGYPKLDGVRTSFMTDRKTAYLELLGDKIDFSYGLESSIANELLNKEGELRQKHTEKMQFLKAPFLNTEYLGINMTTQADDSPLQIKEVRQALNYGLNKEQMLRTLRNNVGQAAQAGFIPKGLPSYNPELVKGYSYNPKKAAKLLADAGHPNGQGLAPITLLTNKDYLDLSTFAARQWEDLGLKIEIDVVESATLRERMRNGQASFFRASWIADYPDGENYLAMYYSKNPAPPNYTFYKNPEFDKLYELAIKENNDSMRYGLYHQMERLLIEDAPVVYLFYDETALFANDEVKGLSNNAINLLKLTNVDFE
jgi:peptide/nickel transport system substrate-binding protein